MGIWATPFESEESAAALISLLAKDKIVKSNEEDCKILWNLIGCDQFWDDVELNYGPNQNLRPKIIKTVKLWIKRIHEFSHINEIALQTLKTCFQYHFSNKYRCSGCSEIKDENDGEFIRAGQGRNKVCSKCVPLLPSKKCTKCSRKFIYLTGHDKRTDPRLCDVCL